MKLRDTDHSLLRFFFHPTAKDDRERSENSGKGTFFMFSPTVEDRRHVTHFCQAIFSVSTFATYGSGGGRVRVECDGSHHLSLMDSDALGVKLTTLVLADPRHLLDHPQP